MEHNTYHHGDLKRTLIENGISLINAEGADRFSLRRVAALCGVSSAAPYAHFESREALLSAMKDHVTEAFMDALREAMGEGGTNEALLQMGRAYVLFFLHNPHYYSFLFSQPDIQVDLSLDADRQKNYPPFALFQETAMRVMQAHRVPAADAENLMIAMWALVHGLASIAAMKNVRLDGGWEARLEAILKSLTVGKLEALS